MTDTFTQVDPLPPIPAADYVAAIPGEDLETICVTAGLADVVGRAVADLCGDDWYDQPTVDDDGRPYEDFNFDIGMQAIRGLVLAGLLKIEWFEYDESNHVVVRRNES